MNAYKISDISVGMKESFTRTVTSEMMQRFWEISADENPLHVDESYAKSRGFPDRVAYGMLTASFISTLGGCYIPGKYCLIQGVEIKFAKPVFIGDELTVLGEISRVDTNLKYLEIKVTIRNQENEKVLRGLLKAGVME